MAPGISFRLPSLYRILVHNLHTNLIRGVQIHRVGLPPYFMCGCNMKLKKMPSHKYDNDNINESFFVFVVRIPIVWVYKRNRFSDLIRLERVLFACACAFRRRCRRRRRLRSSNPSTLTSIVARFTRDWHTAYGATFFPPSVAVVTPIVSCSTSVYDRQSGGGLFASHK